MSALSGVGIDKVASLLIGHAGSIDHAVSRARRFRAEVSVIARRLADAAIGTALESSSTEGPIADGVRRIAERAAAELISSVSER